MKNSNNVCNHSNLPIYLFHDHAHVCIAKFVQGTREEVGDYSRDFAKNHWDSKTISPSPMRPKTERYLTHSHPLHPNPNQHLNPCDRSTRTSHLVLKKLK